MTDAARSRAAQPLGVRDVSHAFIAGREPVWALHDIDLTVDDGSFTCIVGPSGCGKSTLLRILGGLIEPTVGSVQRPAAERPEFVFQEHGVFAWFTVLDNVAFGLRMAGVGKRDRLATARDWIGRVGLSEFADHYPHQLSGGMRQRVAIARAFATGSPTLLMDEPLGALDAQTRLVLQQTLLRLWDEQRKTVVLVTHSIEEALLLGDRIVVMSARPGRVKQDIAVPFDRPRTAEVETDPRFATLRQDIWALLRDDQGVVAA